MSQCVILSPPFLLSRWQLPSCDKDAGSGHTDKGGRVLSPMPGRVVKLQVKEGQKVNRDYTRWRIAGKYLG